MSKHNKVNFYGKTKATFSVAPSFAAESSSISWLSTVNNFIDLLDSFGIDLTAMLLLFWCLIAFIVVIGINFYLTITKRQQRITNERNLKKSQKERENNLVNESINSKAATFSSSSFGYNSTAKRLSYQGCVHSDRNEQDCDKWIHEVIDWLTQSGFNTPAIINECINSWFASLNSKSRQLIREVSLQTLFSVQSTK